MFRQFPMLRQQVQGWSLSRQLIGRLHPRRRRPVPSERDGAPRRSPGSPIRGHRGPLHHGPPVQGVRRSGELSVNSRHASQGRQDPRRLSCLSPRPRPTGGDGRDGRLLRLPACGAHQRLLSQTEAVSRYAPICPRRMSAIDTTFGILHSRFHQLCALRTCPWLGVGNDPRYTPTTTFETFPFP